MKERNDQIFEIYKSSAGSGKTTALIKVFLKLSLGGESIGRFKSILAITFTNKAANELKERFLSALEKIIDQQEGEPIDFLVNDLMNELNLSLDELKSKARKVYRMALRDYGDIAIGTIDGFNHRLIRSFSRDLHLSGDFEVELEEARLFTEAVDLLMDQVGKNDHVTRHLVDYLRYSIEEDDKANIPAKLQELRSLITSEESIQGVFSVNQVDPEIFGLVREKLFKFTKDYEESLKSIGKKGMELLETHGISVQDLHGKGRGIFKFFEKLKDYRGGRHSVSGNLRPKEGNSWAHGQASKEKKRVVEGIDDELSGLFIKGEALQEQDFSKYDLAKDLISRIDLLAVIQDLNTELHDLIKERNILPISDFNRLISESLRNEPVAYIYEKFGSRYNHLLIDEFQDTSELQWKNLTPFIAENLSSGNLNMVVGDAKQSIYRWRGGKAEQLIRLPELDPEDESIPFDTRRSFEHHSKIIPLDTNYRSLRNIVEFNNQFITALAPLFTEEGSLFRDEYSGESATQKFQKNREGGFIQMRKIPGKNAKNRIVDQTLKCVRDALNDGYDYGDIAILIRKKGPEISEIISALHAERIPFSTKDSFGLDQDPIAGMLIAFLRYSTSDRSEAAKAKIIRVLCDLHDIPHQPEEYTYRKGKKRLLDLPRFFLENFSEFSLNRLGFRGAWSLVSEVISELVPERKRGNPFVESLLNCILEKGGRSVTPREFLEWWDSLKEKPEAKTQGSGNQIEIMTIHKSKGLEFPVVIIPNLNWQMDNHKTVKWIEIGETLDLPFSHVPLKHTKDNLSDKGFQEVYDQFMGEVKFDNLNLIYVAVTRASERLYGCFTIFNSSYTGVPVSRALDGLKAKWSETAPFEFNSWEETDGSDEEAHVEVTELGSRDRRIDPEDKKSDKRALRANPPSYTPFESRFKIGRESMSESRDSGILFHRLAEKTSNLREAEKIIDIWKLNGRSSDAVLNEVLGLIRSLYSDEWYLALLSSSQRLTERQLFGKDGDQIRPDAIFLNEKEFTIIDFKTGTESENHRDQVRKYLSVLGEVLNREGKGYVLYVPALNRVEVENNLSRQGKLF